MRQFARFLLIASACLLLLIPTEADTADPAKLERQFNAHAGDFIYVTEEATLVPGRGHQMTTYYLSRDGLIQVAEIVDDRVVRFKQGETTSENILASAATLRGRGFATQERSDSVTGTDAVYPPFECVYYSSQGKHTRLYCGLVSVRPPEITTLAARIHALKPFGDETPRSGPFLQARPLDPDTAENLRRDGHLAGVRDADLGAAAFTATALKNPFRLIVAPVSGGDSYLDALHRGRVIDLEYAGTAFQLIYLTSSETERQQ